MRANPRKHAWICAAVCLLPGAVPAAASQEAALLRDLTSVIALLGLPCGQVVGAKPLKDDDHVATCRDGNRYRVFIDPEGRVVAQPIGPQPKPGGVR